MKLSVLLAELGLACPGADVEVTGVSYDSRTLRPGELFMALPGFAADGRDHIRQALRKGAAAVVTQGEAPALPGPVPILAVSDGRAALAALGAAWYGDPGEALTLVGVTGTNGKTTVTNLLRDILAAQGHRVGLLGTNRVLVGEEEYPACRTTPESLDLQGWLRTMADAGCTHVVMEVSSHALCLHRVDGLDFAVGAFTNLTQDHLDFHKTMEAYRAAKGRLFDQSQTAVLNLDDPAGEYYVNRISCPAVTYAQSRAGADLTARDLRLSSGGVAFQAEGWGERVPVELHIPGAFTVSNALCALACAEVLGVPLRDSARALAQAPGVKGRMEVVPTPGPGTVVIDYAHTPDALENVLLALKPFVKGRLICLFGCGGDRDKGKRPLMGAIAARLSDVCVVTSDNPRTEEPEAIIAQILAGMEGLPGERYVEPDREKAIALALGLLGEGDTLLLAGKGHETYQEVNGEKRHMDERELILLSFEKESRQRKLP